MEEEKLIQDPSKATQCTASLNAVGDALYAIGGKWKLRIIIALSDGNKRFTELQKRVEGISARVLSSELKELELNGFVHRKVLMEYPIVIEYELAPYSHTLGKVIQSLSEWGFQHREKIKNDRHIDAPSINA